MSRLQLFKIMEIIVRKYSKTAVRFLIENYLRVKVVYNIPISSLESFLSQTDLSPGVVSVFLKRTKYERSVSFACIVVDHPKLPTVTHKVLEEIQNCIVFGPSLAQRNNVLGRGGVEDSKEFETKVILFRSQRESFEALSESLDAYLSICELFHSHIHLTLNCFEASSRIDLRDHFAATDGDEFEGVMEDGYFRILEERAGRITLEQLSEMCMIERTGWGELLVFEEGHDGLIVWVTQRFLPKLDLSPSVAIPANRAKQYLLFQSSLLGFKVFKKRQLLKEKMHEMRFTTLIFNCHEYSPALDRVISNRFDEYCRTFFSEVVMKTEIQLLEENVRHGERICEILGIDRKQLLHKLLTIT